jgi:hypothetical protein
MLLQSPSTEEPTAGTHNPHLRPYLYACSCPVVFSDAWYQYNTSRGRGGGGHGRPGWSCRRCQARVPLTSRRQHHSSCHCWNCADGLCSVEPRPHSYGHPCLAGLSSAMMCTSCPEGVARSPVPVCGQRGAAGPETLLVLLRVPLRRRRQPRCSGGGAGAGEGCLHDPAGGTPGANCCHAGFGARWASCWGRKDGQERGWCVPITCHPGCMPRRTH